MDDNELFAVFTAENNPEPVQKTQRGTSRKTRSHTDDTTCKRSRGDQADGVGEDEPQTAKRLRKNDTPVVLDSFETESEQIVPAIEGLQGVAPVDQSIVIKKRVTTGFLCI